MNTPMAHKAFDINLRYTETLSLSFPIFTVYLQILKCRSSQHTLKKFKLQHLC